MHDHIRLEKNASSVGVFSVLKKFQSQVQGNQPLVFRFIFQIPLSFCNFFPSCRSRNAERFANIWKVHAALPTSAHWFRRFGSVTLMNWISLLFFFVLLPLQTANWSMRPEQSSTYKLRMNLITLTIGKQLKWWQWKLASCDVRLHSPFFCGGADKTLGGCCYLQNGLSLSLWLSPPMPHRDIYWSLKLMTFGLSSLPACLFCLHTIIPFCLLMFCFLNSVWILSSRSLYIYIQITFASFSFYLFIHLFFYFTDVLSIFKLKWAKTQWFNTVQRE